MPTHDKDKTRRPSPGSGAAEGHGPPDQERPTDGADRSSARPGDEGCVRGDLQGGGHHPGGTATAAHRGGGEGAHREVATDHSIAIYALVADGRKLLEGVTPEPWRALLSSRGMTGVHSEADGGCKLYHVELAEGAHPDTHARQKAVAAFIADARTRMPAALDEIERLAGENERLRERLAMAIELAPDGFEWGNPRIPPRLRGRAA